MGGRVYGTFCFQKILGFQTKKEAEPPFPLVSQNKKRELNIDSIGASDSDICEWSKKPQEMMNPKLKRNQSATDLFGCEVLGVFWLKYYVFLSSVE